jgi:hypothetical protein
VETARAVVSAVVSATIRFESGTAIAANTATTHTPCTKDRVPDFFIEAFSMLQFLLVAYNQPGICFN